MQEGVLAFPCVKQIGKLKVENQLTVGLVGGQR